MTNEARADRDVRVLAILLPLCVALTLGLGLTRVFVQKAHPPAWARAYNTYAGFVTIDGYARRAEAFQHWFRGEDEGGAALGRDLRNMGHANALLLPILIAALGLPLGSIPAAFLLLSSVCFLVLIRLTVELGARLLPENPRLSGLLAGLLVAGHCLSMRTAGGLILDPFTAAFATLAVLLALRLCERPGRGTAAALFAVQLLGCFIKLSYLPFLAAPALVAWFGSKERRLERASRSALVFGLLPALPMLCYAYSLPTLSDLSFEMNVAVDARSMMRTYLRQYAVELAMILQFLPWVLLRRSGTWTPAERAVLAAAVPAFLANLFISPPINPRLYFPPLVLMLAACTPAVLEMSPGRRIGIALPIYLVMNLALGAAGIVLMLRG